MDIFNPKPEQLERRSPSKINRAAWAPDILGQDNPLARILDLAADAIISIDSHQSIIFFNRSAEVAFGYSATEVRGKRLKLLLPRGLLAFHRQPIGRQRQAGEIAGIGSERREIVGRRKDGSEFPAEVSLSKIEVAGRTIVSLMLQEVTAQALTEVRLRAALREKEVLLEEVHHRVKNNLQVITSLLRLQARSIKDPSSRIKFVESRLRIQAMAILHEILDESSSLAEIDFADYLQRLVAHLIRSYGATGRIRVRLRLDPLSCHRDVALPCGLIVNEILSNAFKYAFPSGKAGEVRIELRRELTGTVRLLVADDGVGLPSGWDWKTSRTLGLQLVSTLARQIEAKVQVDRRNGTAFTVAFRDGLPLGL
ncbi:MAG: histidine kinase dimerization/phosphoacceptor domain -containing protein [Acidobacteriota bacterium]